MIIQVLVTMTIVKKQLVIFRSISLIRFVKNASKNTIIVFTMLPTLKVFSIDIGAIYYASCKREVGIIIHVDETNMLYYLSMVS